MLCSFARQFASWAPHNSHVSFLALVPVFARSLDESIKEKTCLLFSISISQFLQLKLTYPQLHVSIALLGPKEQPCAGKELDAWDQSNMCAFHYGSTVQTACSHFSINISLVTIQYQSISYSIFEISGQLAWLLAMWVTPRRPGVANASAKRSWEEIGPRPKSYQII